MKKKVALLGPPNWALGSINFFLKKYLSKYYDVCVLSWSISHHVKASINGSFDVVIGEKAILSLNSMGYLINKKTKLMPVFHHNSMEINSLETKSKRFDNDVSDVIQEYDVYGTSLHVCSSVKERYDKECSLLPIGVCDDFWNKRDIKQIKTAGINYSIPYGNGDDYESIKRFGMFRDICKKSNIDYSVLDGKNFMRAGDIYSSCDAVLCTSTSEGLPMGFLECAASKIPFFSTNVGIVKDFESSLIFNDLEEAVVLVDLFKDNDTLISIQVERAYEEVMDKLSWQKVIDEYWYPEIEKAIN
jgi:hypothetical protein